MNSIKVQRKKPLSIHDVSFITNRFQFSTSHDNLLFTALLVTGFHALLHLGELTFPDNQAFHDWRKVTRRTSLCVHSQDYEFLLPAHKADPFLRAIGCWCDPLISLFSILFLLSFLICHRETIFSLPRHHFG